MQKRSLVGISAILFGVLLIQGCFLFEEETPDVEQNKSLSYEVPSGYTLYFIVRNLTTSTKKVAVWGENISSIGTTKSIMGDILPSQLSSYPIMGLPPSFQKDLPKENWRTSLSRLSKNILFTFGSASPLGYGQNPSNWIIGTTKLSFKVANIQYNRYDTITATLVAIGTNTNVGASPSSVAGAVAYIFKDDAATVDPSSIAYIAEKFNGTNGIYAKLTNILGGYEYGGGPSGDGGIDNNKTIYILLHDIQDGYSGSGGFVAGYYDPGNDFPISQFPNSSEKQMFVIDTYPTLSSSVDMAISTLAHEAQHMINFGQKHFIGGVDEETWLNEACSLAVEDVLDEFVTNSNDRVYANGSRISYFISRPERGLFQWAEDNEVLYDYGKAYAYLAFLMRQTSPRILKEIVSGAGRDKIGKNAVNAALTAVGAGKTFEETVRLWQKALIYNDYALSSSWSGYRTNTNLPGFELRALNLQTYANDRSSTGPVFYYFRSSSTTFTFAPYSTYIFKGKPSSGTSCTVWISDDPSIEIEAIITNL